MYSPDTQDRINRYTGTVLTHRTRSTGTVLTNRTRSTDTVLTHRTRSTGTVLTNRTRSTGTALKLGQINRYSPDTGSDQQVQS